MNNRDNILNPGDMRHRIILEKPTKVPDSQGGFTTTWSTQATIWAYIEPMNSRELIQAQQAQLDITTKIKIWYRSDVKAEWRLKFGNRYFNIESIINPNESNIFLILICIERK